MFKSARWRSEKNKIKAVFKLQFQATQVPQSRRNTLTISLVPEDVGKPTVRLGKAPVEDGTCSWENPVYETVKFIREPKTGKINEKIYYFIVSTGSSKSGFLGEVSIDFADYVEATIPFTVSLPLTTSNSAAVLHVTIQKMQGAVDQREEDGLLSVKSEDRSLKNQTSNYDTDVNGNHYSTEDGNFRVSSSSSATLASRSDTIFGQNNTTIHQDPIRQNSMPQKGTVDAIVHRRSNTDWSVGSASDGSMADSTNSPEDNFTREGLQETSDSSIEKLKSEIVMLMRQAEFTELELQSLRKQVVKESKKGQDLSRQIVSLKEERDALKTECIDDKEVSNKLQHETEDLRVVLEEIRKELNYEKDLNTNLRLQLQRTEDSNSELILGVRDLDEMLEQKNREISHLSSKIETSGNAEEVQEKVSKCKMHKDEDEQALEELVKENNDATEVDLLKQKILDLYGEIEFYRKDREELVMQMEQVALNYESFKKESHESSKLEQNERSGSLATIKELESRVEILEKEIKKQEQELSQSLDAIQELQTQVRSLEKELEKQAEGFEGDLQAMTHDKIEQEQRAIRAEEALRKTRWNYVTTAERLQEEFRRLSVEMASKFDENEKMATKALTEANELRLQKSILEEMLQKANEELGLIEDRYRIKLQELSNQIDLKAKQIDKMSSELNDKSEQLDYAKKHEEEKHEAVFTEIQMLRAEIERLAGEKNEISEKAEQKEKLREQMKTSIGETEVANLKEKLRLLEEQIKLKEATLENSTNSFLQKEKDLNSKIEDLKSSMEQLNHSRSFSGDQFQKEAKCSGNITVNASKRTKAGISVQNGVDTEPVKSKGETCSEKERKISNFHISEECNLTELLTEVTSLKERNKSMEGELKEMQERYSEISLKFAEVEGERQKLVMTIRNLKNGKKN